MIGRTTDGITDVTTSIADRIISWGLASLIVSILLVALLFVASIAIAKKAGYSGWWGAIFVLAWPFAWLFLGIFAVLKWPALKERDEAFAVLRENNLTTPSHDRKAVREERRKREAEEQAERDVEKAKAARLKAEAEQSKLQARTSTPQKGVAAQPGADSAAPATDRAADAAGSADGASDGGSGEGGE